MPRASNAILRTWKCFLWICGFDVYVTVHLRLYTLLFMFEINFHKINGGKWYLLMVAEKIEEERQQNLQDVK